MRLIRLSLTLVFLGGLKSFALEANDTVPIFVAMDDQGHKWTNAELLGKKGFVAYFYPAAMTSGCTKQSCAFQDDLEYWKQRNFIVVGISGDLPENLSLFKEVNQLEFTLLSDPKGKIAKIFGVPFSEGGEIQKFIDGERFSLHRGVTPRRWSFVVSKKGRIIHKDTEVTAGSNSSDLLRRLQP